MGRGEAEAGNLNHGLRGFSRMGKRAGVKGEHPTSNVQRRTLNFIASGERFGVLQCRAADPQPTERG
jgi:hypothetical protein